MLTKKHIRNKISVKRNKLSEEFISFNSDIIMRKLIEKKEYKKAKIIYIYMSKIGEVDTKNIIKHSLEVGKKVAIPKIINEEMYFYYINSIEDTKKGYFDINEPINIEENNLAIPKGAEELIIMPGVAFDYNKHRIGCGKGFYDKYLSKNKFTKKIAITFNFQILENIPNSEFDVLPDIIITEKCGI